MQRRTRFRAALSAHYDADPPLVWGYLLARGLGAVHVGGTAAGPRWLIVAVDTGRRIAYTRTLRFAREYFGH